MTGEEFGGDATGCQAMECYGVRWRGDTALRMGRRPRWEWRVDSRRTLRKCRGALPAAALRAMPKRCRGATALHSASAGFDAVVAIARHHFSSHPRDLGVRNYSR